MNAFLRGGMTINRLQPARWIRQSWRWMVELLFECVVAPIFFFYTTNHVTY